MVYELFFLAHDFHNLARAVAVVLNHDVEARVWCCALNAGSVEVTHCLEGLFSIHTTNGGGSERLW